MTGDILSAGAAVPHFDVRDVRGGRVRYRETFWQKQALVLVLAGGEDAAGVVGAYAAAVEACGGAFAAAGAECLVTRDAIPGLPPCGLVVADQWGEVMFVQQAASPDGLVPPQELVEWAEYVRRRCPECEGEVR